MRGKGRQGTSSLRRGKAYPGLPRSGGGNEEGDRLKGREASGGKGDEARVRAVFRVPLEFAFGWCTDYTPEDAALEGETYQRKIIERSKNRVIFEDL